MPGEWKPKNHNLVDLCGINTIWDLWQPDRPIWAMCLWRLHTNAQSITSQFVLFASLLTRIPCISKAYLYTHGLALDNSVTLVCYHSCQKPLSFHRLLACCQSTMMPFWPDALTPRPWACLLCPCVAQSVSLSSSCFWCVSCLGFHFLTHFMSLWFASLPTHCFQHISLLSN